MAREQLSIKLSASEQENLKVLARKLNCFTGTGEPSFRPLVRAIANGHLVVSRPTAEVKGGDE